MDDVIKLLKDLVKEVDQTNGEYIVDGHWTGSLDVTSVVPITFHFFNITLRSSSSVKLVVEIDNNGDWFRIYLYTTRGNYYGSYEGIRNGKTLTPVEMILNRLLPECVKQIREIFGITKYRSVRPPKLKSIYYILNTLISFTERERSRWKI